MNFLLRLETFFRGKCNLIRPYSDQICLKLSFSDSSAIKWKTENCVKSLLLVLTWKKRGRGGGGGADGIPVTKINVQHKQCKEELCVCVATLWWDATNSKSCTLKWLEAISSSSSSSPSLAPHLLLLSSTIPFKPSSAGCVCHAHPHNSMSLSVCVCILCVCLDQLP